MAYVSFTDDLASGMVIDFSLDDTAASSTPPPEPQPQKPLLRDWRQMLGALPNDCVARCAMRNAMAAMQTVDKGALPGGGGRGGDCNSAPPNGAPPPVAGPSPRARRPSWKQLPDSMKLLLVRELATWFSYAASTQLLQLTDGEERAFRRLYSAESQKKHRSDRAMRAHVQRSTAAYEAARGRVRPVAVAVAEPQYETDLITIQDLDKAWAYLRGVGLDPDSVDLGHWTGHSGAERFMVEPLDSVLEPALAASHHHNNALCEAGSAPRTRPALLAADTAAAPASRPRHQGSRPA